MRSNRLVANTLANMSSQLVAVVVSIVTLPLLLEAFGQVVYGAFMIANSAVGLISLLDLGTGITTVREIARRDEAGDSERLSETVGTALLLYAALGVLAALALFLTGLFADTLFAIGPEHTSLLRSMLWIHAGVQLLAWPATAGRQVLAGYERYPAIVRVMIAVTLGHAAAILVVLALGEGPLVLTALQAGVTVAGSLAMAVSALRVLPSSVRRVALPKRGAVRAFLALSLPVFTVQVAAFLMRQQADRLVLGVFVGAVAVAVYEAAAKLGSLVAQLNDLTTSAMVPYMTRKEARGDAEGMRDAFLAGTRLTSALLLPPLITLVALAPDVVRVWVGGQLGDAVRATIVAAQLLLLSQALIPTYSVADPILLGQGRYHRWAPYAVGIAVLNVAVSVALVGRLGVVGVAVGTLVAGVVEAPLFVRIAAQELRIPVLAWTRRTLLPAVALGLGTFLLAGLVRTSLAPHSLVFVGAAGILSVGAAYVGAYALFLTADERRLLRSLAFGSEF